MSKRLTVTVKGQGQITLTQNDFLAQGGQGAVYAKGGKAYKIYLDPAKMMPLAKIAELGALTDPRIIRPLDVLTDAKGNPIGYTMRHVDKATALCQLFPKSYRDRAHITHAMVFKLINDLQAVVSHVHQAGLLIVDLNEMNFLVSGDHKDIYAIDVDSYQTRSFPATVLMESVRDRHAKRDARGNMIFNTGTDWFAFAITSFQMFIGIHPFKGKHPKYDDLDARMEHNISVLDSQVLFPRGACQPFSVIPPEYLRWYEAVFHRGERTPPPGGFISTTILVQQPTHITGSKNFETSEVFTLPDSIVSHVQVAGLRVTLTTSGIYQNGKRIYGVAPGETHVAITPKMNHIISASIVNGQLSLHDATAGKSLPLSLAAQGLTEYDTRLYFKNGSRMYEVEFFEGATGTIPSATHVANVHEMSAKVFDGVVMQSLFGKNYAVFFPQKKQSREIELKEIEGQVVAAKYQNNVLVVVGVDAKGIYNRYVFRFSTDFASYDLRIVKNIVYTGINFSVLDNGVCVLMNENEQIELFRNVRGDGTLKIVDDDHIGGDCRIFKEGTTAMFAKGAALYTMTMKK
jgi:serine/threonine protein kinase